MTQVVEKPVSEGSATPQHPREGPNVPKFLSLLAYAQTVCQRATKSDMTTHVLE